MSSPISYLGIPLCIFQLFFSLSSFAQTRITLYTPTDSVIANPERGFVERSWLDQGRYAYPATIRIGNPPWPATLIRALREGPEKITVLSVYCRLDDFISSDISPEFLTLLSQDLDSAQVAGAKVILRFAYNSSNVPIGYDARIDTILRHMSQLRPVLIEHANVIQAMEAGFLGAWGEWHSSSHHSTEDSAVAIQQQVINELLSILPASRFIYMRAPSKLWACFDSGNVDLSTAYSGLPKTRIGIHNDAFLSNASDMGTYDVWRSGEFSDTIIVKPWVAARSAYAPMTGELNMYPGRVSYENLLQEGARFHWSNLNRDYEVKAIDGLKGSGAWDVAARQLGYRLVLLDSEFPAKSSIGGLFSFRISLTNTGWAAPFNPRGLELILRSDADGSVYVIDLYQSRDLICDPRFWFAGDTVQIATTIVIPRSLAAGAYTVLFNLPDPEPSLHQRPEYAIRLANENLWEPQTGYNKLLSGLVLDTSPTSVADPGDGHAGSGLSFYLSQNFPNPFNPSTRIEFTLPTTGHTTLKVYDLLGQQISVLVDEEKAAGNYAVEFAPDGAANGVYFAELIAGSRREIKRMIMLK